MPKNKAMVSSLIMKLEDITSIIFLPLYFTFSGLRTEIGELNSLESWGIAILILAVAFISKTASCAIGAKFIGSLNAKESLCFGILMQTKGLVALIVFNLGLDYGVITPKMFAVNVLMVVVKLFAWQSTIDSHFQLSTCATSPLVELIYPAKKLLRSQLAKGSKDILSVLLCTSNSQAATVMVSVAQPLVQPRAPFTFVVTALHVIPSKSETGHIIGWFYKKKENFFSAPLSAARKTAKTLGMKVDPIAFTTDQEEEGQEICSLAEIRDADLIILGFSEKFNNNAGVASYVLENTKKGDVGILIPHGDPNRLIRTILVPILNPSKSVALKYAVQMAKFGAVSITLLHLMEEDAVKSPEALNYLTKLCTENSTMKVRAGSLIFSNLNFSTCQLPPKFHSTWSSDNWKRMTILCFSWTTTPTKMQESSTIEVHAPLWSCAKVHCSSVKRRVHSPPVMKKTMTQTKRTTMKRVMPPVVTTLSATDAPRCLYNKQHPMTLSVMVLPVWCMSKFPLVLGWSIDPIYLLEFWCSDSSWCCSQNVCWLHSSSCWYWRPLQCQRREWRTFRDGFYLVKNLSKGGSASRLIIPTRFHQRPQ